ncbi:endonuclease domain-containing protein [Agromyces italicus]|uniref:endonuclease domain-containing protein n=1 Tax=Agromyces italicus TaxID=279572 RepID=UPI0003B57AB7|nr:DUF559 domain-containing protein [Agromyces italicus]
MTRRTVDPIPRGGAVRTSEHASFDTTRGRLRAKSIQHPFTGVSAVGLDLEAVVDLCEAYRPLLRPGEAYSHATAALLYGAPLPSWAAAVRPLHVLSPTVTRPRTRGTVGHRAMRAFPVSLRLGLPVVTPADMWMQSAGTLGHRDLVAVGDFLVTGRLHGRAAEGPFCTPAELVAVVERSTGRRGLASARRALEQIRVGAASRPETLLRLVVVEAGLPEPAIGPPVIVAGGLVLHPDLAYPDLRIAIEYEGAGHRDAGRWERDIERRELFEDAGWRVIRITKTALFENPEGIVRRIREARVARAA